MSVQAMPAPPATSAPMTGLPANSVVSSSRLCSGWSRGSSASSTAETTSPGNSRSQSAGSSANNESENG